MTKKTHQSLFLGGALALLLSVITIPMTTTALVRSQDDAGLLIDTSETQIQRAINDRSRVLSTRRDYWDAVAVYQRLVSEGIAGLSAPDINDADSINLYLDIAYVEALQDGVMHGSASNSVHDEVNVLFEPERDLLEGYVSTRRCPASLLNYHLSGFYDLCNRLLEETERANQQERMRRALNW